MLGSGGKTGVRYDSAVKKIRNPDLDGLRQSANQIGVDELSDAVKFAGELADRIERIKL